MKYILTPNEMRKADSTAIDEKGIPSIILMENAARSAAEYLIDIFEESEIFYPRVTFFCGSGNNGGDGFAMARHMIEYCLVSVYWIGSTDKMSEETKANFDSIKNLGINLIHIENEEDLETIDFETDCVVDSMIGVGGSENIRGMAYEILKLLSEYQGLKVAVDAPTGLNTETGVAGDHCFMADITITMFAIKSGMLLNDGSKVCGEIFVAYLGAPESIVMQLSKIKSIEEHDLPYILPIRDEVSSKFDYGRVMVIAGSKRFPGAAAMTANAAIKSGAGLVQLYSTALHPAILPEVIPYEVKSTESGSISSNEKEFLLKEIEKANVVAIGPGLSDDKDTIALVNDLVAEIPDDKSIILDADATRIISKEKKMRKNIIITPHTGEFSRFSGIDRSEIENNSAEIAKKWAKELNCTVLLKHIPVIITDGDNSYWNINGNSGMASGGSGDVLTGIIAGLLAQEIEPLEAAAYAAFIHARAGDIYIQEYSEHTLTASNLLDLIEEAFVY